MEIKKKRRSRIDLDIHHSTVFSSGFIGKEIRKFKIVAKI